MFMLKRGNYTLAHMSQVLGRDEKAAEILMHAGREAYAYMVTDQQYRDRVDGKPGTGLPYRYLVHHPSSSALAWTAFYTRSDMQAFLDAYGLHLDREPSPGESFRIMIPESPVFQELHA